MRLIQLRLVSRPSPRGYGLSGSRFRLGEAEALTDGTFSKVLSAPRAIVDFGSPACHYCEDYKPIFDRLADKYVNNLLMASVVVDDSPQLTKTYGIKGLPATIFFVNGKEVDRSEGFMEEGELEAEITRVFGPITTLSLPPVYTAVPPVEPPAPSGTPPGPLTEAAQLPGLPKPGVTTTAEKPVGEIPVLPVLAGVAALGLGIWYFASRKG